jgi:hypothetical protein
MSRALQTVPPSLVAITVSIENSMAGDACFVFQTGASKDKLETFTEAAEARFSGCEMTLRTSNTTGPVAQTAVFRVNLAALDPQRITIAEGMTIPAGSTVIGEIPLKSLRLATAGGAKVIDVETERIEVDKPTVSETHKASELTVRLKSIESAEKFADAFSRAIRLCREN